MILENTKKFLKYYAKGRYKKLFGFLGLSLTAGFFELLGVALIYPFILLMISKDAFLGFKFIEIKNDYATGFFAGFLVIFVFVLKNLFMIFMQYIQSKFISSWKMDVASKFMEYYIFAPYEKTIGEEEAVKLYMMDTVSMIAIDGFVIRILNLITNSIIVFLIIGFLLIKFPIPALVTIFFTLSSVILQNKFFKHKTLLLSKRIANETREFKTTMMEATSNIKEIKIASVENYFFKNFINKAKTYTELNVESYFYSGIPPYIIEILIIMALFVLAGVVSVMNKGDNSLLIAAFAIVAGAIFRVAPALNRIQTSIININATRNFVKTLNEKYEEYELENFARNDFWESEKLKFEEKIELKNITFSYDNNKNVLEDVSFTINKGDFAGIIGLSGAGKSTLADIITGMLFQNSGEILLDGIALNKKNFSGFRKLVGYVPQRINVLNRSFRENVAFGREEIDDTAVKKALDCARVLEVIEDKGGIYEFANSISIGQKQRLMIARALYTNPEILIFDEATSSLDVKVENEIVQMLKEIGKNKTVIAIAHRLSTLKACNKLIYIKQGKLVDIGNFDELSAKYEEFRELVKLSSINEQL